MFDDRERPGPLTLIRPLGTLGLPNAYERPLKREVSLDLSADADIPDRFITALGEIIREMKTVGTGQKRYRLKKGRRGEAAGSDILYHFPFTDEVELFGEAQIEIRVDQRRVEGTIVSIGAGHLVLALKKDIGNEVRSAELLIYATAFLEALKEKIEAVDKGEITLNRSLADAVVQPGALPKRPARPIRANDDSELDNSQRKAYQNALREALTFIWGPPGCGKTMSTASYEPLPVPKHRCVANNSRTEEFEMKYEVSNIATKLISTDDEDVTVAIKATVKNNSDNEHVLIGIQGVDADGFEIELVHLMGDIPIGETRTLTTRQEYLTRELYEQIAHWQMQ